MFEFKNREKKSNVRLSMPALMLRAPGLRPKKATMPCEPNKMGSHTCASFRS